MDKMSTRMRTGMKSAWLMAVAAAAWAVCPTGAAALYPTSDVPAREIQLRGGIPNARAKAESGAPLTVAYLGGSITQMDGWRNGTTALLKEAFPQSRVTEVNAGIGGTGSSLGAYRVGKDVLSARPDLVFVEFATNDGWSGADGIAANMEGIVRQILRQDAKTDIVFVYTITEHATNSYLKGVCTRAAAAQERVAERYGIPSVNFGPRVASRLKEGRLLIRGAAKGAATPVVLTAAKADASSVPVFAADGTHPNAAGHAVYLESMRAFLEAARRAPAKAGGRALGAPLVADNLERARMAPVTRAMLTGDWKEVVGDQPWYMKTLGGRYWETQTPGAKVTFAFRGRTAALYDLVGPNGGQVFVTVDGKRRPRPVPRFDRYASYRRINPLMIDCGAEGVHVVEIELDAHEPSRASVAESKAKPEKYRGTFLWVAQLMVNGELVPVPTRITLAPGGAFPADDLLRKARAVWAKDPAADIEVLLPDGAYRFEKTVTLSSDAKSLGAHTGRLTFRAANRGKAFFTGGVPVPELKPATGLEDVNFLENPRCPNPRKFIQEADLKAAGITDYGDPLRGMRLVWNGDVQTLARWPNGRWTHLADPVGIVPDAKGLPWRLFNTNSWVRFGLQKCLVPGETRHLRWLKEKDPCGIGYFTSDWAAHSFQFGRIDPATGAVWESPDVKPRGHSYGYFHSCGREHPWYAFNVLCELDRAGEYYIDRERGKLYFWPPAPRKGGAGQCELTLASGAFRARKAGPLAFEGIVFENFRGKALDFTGGGIELVACAIRNVGVQAVALSEAENVRVAGCDVYNIGGKGIEVSAVDGKRLIDGSHNIVIENNHIHDIGQEEFSYVPGVWVWGQGVVVRDNTINAMPHAAIGLGGRETTIRGNDIFDVMRFSGEMGAIYTGRDWSTVGNLIAENWFHDIARANKEQLSRGVMIDDGGAGFTIVSNVFQRLDGSGVATSAIGNRIADNFFVDVTPTPFDCWGGDNAAVMDRNWTPRVHPEIRRRLEALPLDEEPWKSKYPLVGILRECLRGNGRKPPEARTVIENNVWWNEGGEVPLVKWMSRTVATNETAWVIRGNVNERRALPARRYGCYPSPERLSWPLRASKKAVPVNFSTED